MRIPLFFIATVTLFLTSCITMLPASKSDDGSSSISAADSVALRSFDQASADRRPAVAYITGADVRRVASRHRYTIVNVWATWCAHCYVALPSLQQLANNLEKKGCAFLLVAQNVNIPVMKKQLARAGYSNSAYIIEPQSYGTNETQKQLRFCKELAKDTSLYALNGSVPITLVLDSNGQCIKILPGDDKLGERLRFIQ